MAEDAVAKMARLCGLEDEEVAEYRNAFTAFDKDGSGSIDMKELADLLKTIDGVLEKTKTKSIDDLISQVEYVCDFDWNNVLNFPEFLYYMSKVIITKSNDVPVVLELNEIASKADKDGDGYISKEELKVALAKFVAADKIDEEFVKFDEDGDGQVSIKEFRKRFCEYFYKQLKEN